MRYPVLLSVPAIGLLFACGSPVHAQSVQVADGPARREAARETDWSVIAAAGVGYGPTFDGGSDSEAGPAVYLDIIWRNRVQIGMDGINLLFGSDSRGQASVGVGYASGLKQTDDPARRGLGDIEEALEARASVTRNIVGLDWTVEAAHAFGDDGGTRVTAGVSKGWRLNEALTVIGAADVEWADEDWSQARYGVTAAQASRSGLRAFAPSAGLAGAGVSLTAIHALSGPWFVGGQVSYRQLLGDIADSPVSRRDDLFGGLILVGRSF